MTTNGNLITVVVLSDKLTNEKLNETIRDSINVGIDDVGSGYDIYVANTDEILRRFEKENKQFVLMVDLVDEKKMSSEYTRLIREYSESPLCTLSYNAYCYNFLITILASQINIGMLKNDMDQAHERQMDRLEKTRIFKQEMETVQRKIMDSQTVSYSTNLFTAPIGMVAEDKVEYTVPQPVIQESSAPQNPNVVNDNVIDIMISIQKSMANSLEEIKKLLQTSN